MSERELESIMQMLEIIDKHIYDKQEELKNLKRQKLRYEQKAKYLRSGAKNGKADNIRSGQKSK